MLAQTLPSSAGWRWILGGIAIYRRNPLMLSMLLMAYWFAMIFLNLLPVVGLLAASLAMPGLSVGLMQAARNVDRGAQVGLPTLFESFRDNPRTLLAQGALYLCCTLGALGISALIDGGDLVRYLTADNTAERVAVEDADLRWSAMLVMALLLPVMMAYWFGPVLAAWHRMPLAKSLFFSFIACWMNWRPFLSYGIGLFLLAGVLPGLLLLIPVLLFPGSAEALLGIVTVPMFLIVAPIVFASFYASYRDIFGISEIA